MKKAILMLSLALISAGAFAQTKIDTDKKTGKVNVAIGKPVVKDTVKKPVYRYFYEVPEQDFNQIAASMHDYKDGLVYNPLLDDHTQRQQTVMLTYYLARLAKVVKLDSVRIDSPAVAVKPKLLKQKPKAIGSKIPVPSNPNPIAIGS